MYDEKERLVWILYKDQSVESSEFYFENNPQFLIVLLLCFLFLRKYVEQVSGRICNVYVESLYIHGQCQQHAYVCCVCVFVGLCGYHLGHIVYK